MTTDFRDKCKFHSISVVDGTIGTGTVPVSSAINYSITNFSAADRALSATDTTAANVAATVATLISDLAKKGLVVADGGE